MLTTFATRTDFDSHTGKVAVLPIGAIEQHGAHLPVGTDLMLAEALARPLAEALNAYLLPVVGISASMEHRKARGTVYVRAETLALIVRDVAESLRTSGFERLILVNFHGGNWILKPAIRQLNRDFAPFRVVLLQPDLKAADASAILEHPTGDVHGGEYETSLMLHLFPEQVRRLPEPGPRIFPPQPLLDYFDSTDLTRDGFWGWPEAATAEKGQRAFTALIQSSLEFLRQIEAMDETLAKAAGSDVRLRLLTTEDVPFAHELRRIAGWNQTERDWRGYVEFEPEGCFVAEVEGKRAGTATTIRYQDRFGWIGMVLVHPDQRRHGLGTRLLRRAIQYLQQKGVRCVKLDATPMGRKVYVPLGFVDEYGLARYEGTAPVLPVSASTSLLAWREADFGEIAALDAEAFGAERPRVLRSLSARNPEYCFVVRHAGRIDGFLIAREGTNAVQVGPWVARDATCAEALLGGLFARISGRKLFIDVLDPNEASVGLMKKYGLVVQRTLTRMYLGENAHPGKPEWVFGISSAEKG